MNQGKKSAYSFKFPVFGHRIAIFRGPSIYPVLVHRSDNAPPTGRRNKSGTAPWKLEALGTIFEIALLSMYRRECNISGCCLFRSRVTDKVRIFQTTRYLYLLLRELNGSIVTSGCHQSSTFSPSRDARTFRRTRVPYMAVNHRRSTYITRNTPSNTHVILLRTYKRLSRVSSIGHPRSTKTRRLAAKVTQTYIKKITD